MKKNWKNRLVALALTATTALSCAAIGTTSTIGSSAYYYGTYYAGGCGDLNLNGKVDATDLTILLNYIVNKQDSLSSLAKANADTNSDGYVDADDGIMLTKYLNGSVPYLPFDNTRKTGDVNGDGTINVKDLVLLKQYISVADINGYDLSTSLAVPIKCACDVNWDGKVNATDTAILTRYLSGKVTSLPYKG